MPDLDIISRTLPRRWRKPMRLLLGEATPSETARATIQTLAATLRDQEGFPGFRELRDLLDERLARRIDPHSAYVRADAIAHAHQHDRHSKVAAGAARQILAEINGGDIRRIGTLDELLAERCCLGPIPLQ